MHAGRVVKLLHLKPGLLPYPWYGVLLAQLSLASMWCCVCQVLHVSNMWQGVCMQNLSLYLAHGLPCAAQNASTFCSKAMQESAFTLHTLLHQHEAMLHIYHIIVRVLLAQDDPSSIASPLC